MTTLWGWDRYCRFRSVLSCNSQWSKQNRCPESMHTSYRHPRICWCLSNGVRVIRYKMSTLRMKVTTLEHHVHIHRSRSLRTRNHRKLKVIVLSRRSSDDVASGDGPSRDDRTRSCENRNFRQHETLLKARSLGVVSISHLTRTNLEPRSGREPNGLIREGARLFQGRSRVLLSTSRGTRNRSEKQIVSEEELSCRLVLT